MYEFYGLKIVQESTQVEGVPAVYMCQQQIINRGNQPDAQLVTDDFLEISPQAPLFIGRIDPFDDASLDFFNTNARPLAEMLELVKNRLAYSDYVTMPPQRFGLYDYELTPKGRIRLPAFQFAVTIDSEIVTDYQELVHIFELMAAGTLVNFPIISVYCEYTSGQELPKIGARLSYPVSRNPHDFEVIATLPPYEIRTHKLFYIKEPDSSG